MIETLENKKKGQKSFWKWIKENKKLLIALGIISVTGVSLTIITIKNWDAIKQLFRKKVTNIEDGKKVVAEIADSIEKNTPQIPSDFKFSGNKLTATELGNKMGVSNREINKRLVEKGFQEKCYNNEYTITPYGQYFGVSKWKVKRSGHSFVNNEWDENIIELLFTKEEIEKHERLMEYAKATSAKNLNN